jgi:BirA family transcriptional regulator, biotin operon repressor / biotin---[acetyl-CoA-carboxylase] ligase
MSFSEFEKKLVAALKANRDRYLDEETLLGKLGLSEVIDPSTEGGCDLSRAVEILRLQGYGIDGDESRGWCLVKLPDTLNSMELENGLRTSFLGRCLFSYSIIGSTNETARMLAESGAPEGALLVAEEQSNGRGRFANTWFSPAGGGIWASLILRPKISPAQVGCLGMLTALSICLAVEELTGLEPRIKWPNDLLIDGRKIAGILCEGGIKGPVLRHVIVGFGVNVNIREFPPALEGRATSLLLAGGGTEISRIELMQLILEKLEEGYFKLHTDGFASFLPRVQVRNYLRDRPVRIEVQEGRQVAGLVRGIDENGALLIETAGSGRLTTVSYGHVIEY